MVPQKYIYPSLFPEEELNENKTQFWNEFLVFSQTMEHIMLQKSGTINVPE